jgi:GT2 family glycosyltransferase
MDISIIIVGWNTRRYVEECLDSLAVARTCRSIEVIVVDNASADGSAEMVERRFPDVKLIRAGENLGFAKANNRAIRECQGRYVCLVNPDVKLLPGCLDALADFLDQHPEVGNVGPRVLNSDLTLQSSCRRFPTLWNNFCSATGLAVAFKRWRLFSGEHMLFFRHDRIAAVDVLVGCFWMIRRKALTAVGLLDEGFFMYGEDVDWCRRCWNAGWQVVFFPDASAIHARGGASAADPVGCAVMQQQSILRYWSKHHCSSQVLAMQGILLCSHVIRYLFAVLPRFGHRRDSAQNDTRKQVSITCLRTLPFPRVSHMAQGAGRP